MKRRAYGFLLFLLIPVLAFALAGAFPVENREYYARITATLARELPREHLSRRQLNDAIIHQTINNYIASLDFDRAYFLATDIQQFEARTETLRQELLDGDNSFAFEVFETFRDRVQNRMAYINRLLENEFDFTIEEQHKWNRRKEEWTAGEAEWDELWRKRIKNEYLRRVLNEGDADEDDAAPYLDIIEKPEETTTPDQGGNTNDENQPALEDNENSDAETSLPIATTPEEFIKNRYLQYQLIIDGADTEWILQKYLSAFARAFDPHCDYMFPSAAEDFAIEMKLSLVGIGAVLRPEDGAARIVSLIPGGPAASDNRDNRLRPGDKIIAVAQDKRPAVNILHWPLYRSVRLIRGEVGTRVVLTVIPASDPTGLTTKTVDLIRAEVKLEEREARSDIREVQGDDGIPRKIGIISLPTFYADMHGRRNDPEAKSVSRDVAAILRNMRKEKVAGIILDLRNNGGGSLLESVLMTGLFIETGPVVQVRERRSVSILPNNDPTIAYGGPLIVLVNRVSASASEILAAALQDYGRAIIIGDSQTHGKGSVQSVTPLGRRDDSGSIKITSALFYRITGDSTQLRGVVPDIVIPSAFDAAEYGEEFLDNPLEWTRVQPAMYSVFGNLQPLVTTLREKSETRRTEDPRFIAYMQMLERIHNMNESKTIPLHLETRRQHAATEKELAEIQNQLMDQTDIPDKEEKEERTDLVKDETMRILADWILLQEKAETSDAS